MLYSLVLVVISIPVSLLAIRAILMKETDGLLALHARQFVQHIKNYEYLDDLEMDLGIWDQLSYDVSIGPATNGPVAPRYQTLRGLDEAMSETRMFRSLSSYVVIKGKPYILTIRMSLADNDDLLLALGAVQVVMIVLLAGGLLLINRSLTKRLWKPFYGILSRLKAYRVDKNGPVQSPKTDITEFDDLNEAVGHLMERNRKVFLQQKEFIENASHELQTPLAIFHGKLDNLMQNTTLNEGDAATLLELEETAQRMARLNKNLLLLSKIDNDQFSDLEQVPISQLAQTLLENLNDLAIAGKLSIEVSVEPTTVTGNATLMEILLTNLFHNAIRHSPTGGRVQVRLKAGLLEVGNSAPPLGIGTDKIFDRFVKGGGGIKNTGLGLAIVKRICEVSGFQLAYHYLLETHTFTVRFH